MEKIDFTFSGGMADLNELNFYEAGRFNYGAARFIYTLEKFRQDGIVVSRLSTKVNADIRVKAPKPGSFWQQVLIYSAPIVAECAFKVPFEALFAHVWTILLPSSRSQDVAVELAKLEVERDRVGVDRERERTAQMKIMSNVVELGQANLKDAIAILGYAVKNARILYSADVGHFSRQDIAALKAEAESAQNREHITRPFADQLAEIDPKKERRLTSQLRSPVREMALPLRSSADHLSIGSTEAPAKFASLESSSVSYITGQKEDEDPIVIRGKIKSYDVESGYGRFRYEANPRPIPFRVVAAAKGTLGMLVVDAMKKENVLCSLYAIRDVYGSITSFILDDILDEDEFSLVHRI